MEIEVLPPDVNRSDGDFTVIDGKIQIGLAAIKGCGGSAGSAIAAARKAGGPFRSLFDFCERVDAQQIGRSGIETLIKAGAFDSLGARRSQWMAVIDRAVQAGAATLADRRRGQKGLFEAMEDEPAAAEQTVRLPDVPDWDAQERLAREKEVLGFYLSSHPLAEHQKTLGTYCSHDTLQVASLAPRTEVVLGGMISAVKISQTKNPRPGSTHTKYAMFDLEDMSGIIRCILWPEDYANFGHLVVADAILVVRGAVDRRPGSEESNLIVNELIPLSDVAARFTRGIKVRLLESQHGSQGVSQLHEIVRGYPGNCELQILLCLADGRRVHMKSQRVRVGLNAELRERLDALLGPGNVQMLAAPPPPPPRGSQAGRPRELAAR
jgi:DNA polymerase-3 subunit alpha